MVQVDGQEFAIGEGAWNHGQSANGMDYIGLASPARKALFFANLVNYLVPGTYQFEQLVIGLPVPLLMDNTQAQGIFDRLKALKDEAVFTCDQGEYVFSFNKIKVLAQPVGAYANWLLDDALQPQFTVRDAEVLADIGMNTLDLYVFKGGKSRQICWRAKWAYGGCCKCWTGAAGMYMSWMMTCATDACARQRRAGSMAG